MTEKDFQEQPENIEGEDIEEEAINESVQLREVPDDGIERRWYALHAHSGQESMVREMLLSRAAELEKNKLLVNAFVPIEEVEVMRGGEKRMSKHKCFPGYVLVQLPIHPEKYADLWHMIKETPSVTGFIGSRTVPVPLEDSEVQSIIEVVLGERERPKPKLDFEVGERVRINDGPFANFLGRIEEINTEQSLVVVMVEIFERQTNVEVEFWQIEQI
ncbi:MAG: transcription termination/antitermination factor NusG [Candidatus Hydrogenedentes bacterium]|nr:transcription termination/antitermination factor NusG [Candidatus Hydrogenedentota bacterium]